MQGKVCQKACRFERRNQDSDPSERVEKATEIVRASAAEAFAAEVEHGVDVPEEGVVDEGEQKA